jgi:uridylate kinase
MRKKALDYFKKGSTIIFSCGTSNPYFTTDTTAALRAIELNADVLLKATQVDGVYTADPKKDKSATRYAVLTFKEAIDKKLAVMDMTAFTLCMENNMPIIVFDFYKPGNIEKVVKGDTSLGTVIKNG